MNVYDLTIKSVFKRNGGLGGEISTVMENIEKELRPHLKRN